MSKPVIDYSEIPVQETSVSDDSWEAPRHVYFGKKDPNTGKMEKEPVYRHQPFPEVMYRKREDGSIQARQVDGPVEQRAAVAAGFVSGLTALGVVTCPSRDQVLEAEEMARLEALTRPKAITGASLKKQEATA